MKRWALVIGSQTHGLAGVDNDASALAQLLQDRGFTVDRRTGADATRDGILDGYRALIGRCSADDAALFFYAGHGALVTDPQAGPGQRSRVQCIVPTDFGAGRFRGVLDVELSVLLGELTGRTPNVTVVLDCCHAQEMSRAAGIGAAGAVARALPPGWSEGVAEMLATGAVDLRHLRVEANPLAVRLVATEVDRSAYEIDLLADGQRRRRGLFTWALEQALAEAGERPVSVRTLIGRVREHVLAVMPTQRPILEGPDERLLFSTATTRRPDAVLLFRDALGPALRASRVLGAQVGAVYDVMPLGDGEFMPQRVVAQATVTALAGDAARVALSPADADVASGALAFPRRQPHPPVPVWIDDGVAPALRNALVASHLVEAVTRASEARFTVRQDAEQLHVLDLGRAALVAAADEGGCREIRQRFEDWSRAEALRTLQPGGIGAQALAIERGRVIDGVAVPAESGEPMRVGERLYLTIRSDHERELCVAVFDVGISGRVALATPPRKLAPRDSFTLGRRDELLRGLALRWPPTVPADGPRRESLVVVATDHWVDFTLLETPQATQRGGPLRGLEAVLDSIRDGATRELDDSGDPQAYGSWCIDFDLVP